RHEEKGRGLMEPMATPEEVSRLLRIPTKTLAQWRWQGKGPKWSKMGSHVRYAWSDVEKYRKSTQSAA
ncbi:MAG: helix-turn-helix domain-containing protein, partial [Stackebrandtia sp.]